MTSLKQPIGLGNLADQKGIVFEVDHDKVQEDGSYEDEEDYYEDDSQYYDEQFGLGEVIGKKKLPFSKLLGHDPEYTFEWFETEGNIARMISIHEGGTVTKSVISEGNGPNVSENFRVAVHYALSGHGMTEAFDSTVFGPGRPEKVNMKNSGVIPGLLVAIGSMRLKEVSRFWISSDLAFGKMGCPPRVPPSFDLYAIVQVVDLTEEGQLTIEEMTSEERAVLNFEDIFNRADHLRRSANDLYADNAYHQAVQRYKTAIYILENYPTTSEAEHNKRQLLKYKLHSNLGATFLKLDRFPGVCLQCQGAMSCVDKKAGIVPDEKLFFRWATAKLRLGHASQALEYNKKAERITPHDKEIKRQKQEIIDALNREEQANKILMTRIGEGMFGSPKPKPRIQDPLVKTDDNSDHHHETNSNCTKREG